MEHKVESFEIAGKIEMLVGWDETIKKDREIIEWHGFKDVTEPEVDQKLTSIEIVIPGGKAVNILPSLNEKQRQEIIDNLSL